MLNFLVFLRSFPFNDKFNGVFKKTYKEGRIKIDASGSRICWVSDFSDDVMTKPENCVDPESKIQWCSSFDSRRVKKQWISFTFEGAKLNLQGYSLHAGCCSAYRCCCKIYSWSIQGSNDNVTWTTLDKVEKDEELFDCANKSFPVKSNGNSYKTIRLIQDESEKGCPTCIDLTKIEIYGDLNDENYIPDDLEDNEEVSIIGKVTNN